MKLERLLCSKKLNIIPRSLFFLHTTKVSKKKRKIFNGWVNIENWESTFMRGIIYARFTIEGDCLRRLVKAW